MASKAVKKVVVEKEKPNKETKLEKEATSKVPRTCSSRFSKFKPFNALCSQIYIECTNTEFNDAEINPSKPLKERHWTAKSKLVIIIKIAVTTPTSLRH